jgi:hypothetical protein
MQKCNEIDRPATRILLNFFEAFLLIHLVCLEINVNFVAL